MSLVAGPSGSQSWSQFTLGGAGSWHCLLWDPRCPIGGFHTLQCGDRFQSCWLRAPKCPRPGVYLLVHCTGTQWLLRLVWACWWVAFFLVWKAKSRSYAVSVVCLLVCGAGSWVLWLQGSGGVQELVLWAIGGWGWVQGMLGLGPNHWWV